MSKRPQIGTRQFPLVRRYMLLGKFLVVTAAIVNGALGAFFVALHFDKH